MANGICFKFNVSHHAVMVLLVLGATVVFLLAKVLLLEVVLARCQNDSSKLCCHFDTLESRSLQQRRLRKNDNCGTITGYHGVKWSLKKLRCEVVGRR